MSESNLERLNRFTPDAGGLNRDALLFAAGRASARPNRAWMSLAAALAGTQVLALVLLWPQAPAGSEWPRPFAGSHAPPAREAATANVSAHEHRHSPGVWSVRHELGDVELDDAVLNDAEIDQPTDAVTLIEAGPPLRAFGPPPSSVFN